MLTDRSGPENHGDSPDAFHPQTAVERLLPVERWGSAGILIAVSGGPDSVALAHAAIEVARRYLLAGPRPAAPPSVCLAHVNHQLRGEDSEEDEALVRRLADQWNTGFAVVRGPAVHQASVAREQGLPDLLAGRPREDGLRRFRYAALARLAAERGQRLILTAHHADDLVETMLFRLFRGTGLRGLRGIPATRQLGDGLTLARPLLGISKARLLSYVLEHRLAFRRDRSNDSSAPSRNWIRNEVVPLLRRRFGGGVNQRLAELAAEAADVTALVDDAAARLLELCRAEYTTSEVRLDARPCRQSPPAVIQAALVQIWKQQHWPEGQISRDHWRQLSGLVSSSRAEPRVLELPGRITVQRDDGGRVTLRGAAPPLGSATG